jgi:hypothetical protein
VSSPTFSNAIHQGHGSTQLAHSPVCVNKERAPIGRPAVFNSIFVITMDEEKLILLVQEHECLYNLSNPDYDDNLVESNLYPSYNQDAHKHCRALWV